MFAFGSGVLQGFRTDIANSTPVNFGLVQDTTLDWGFDLKEGHGQFQHPVVLARGKTKVTAKSKVLRVSPLAFGTLFFGVTPAAGQVATAFAEQWTLPDQVGSVFTVTIASPGVFTLNNHGFVAGNAVSFATTGALPTGLAILTVYYVISAGLTTNNFEVAATPGGAAINTSGSQSGVQTIASSGVAVTNSATFVDDLGVVFQATGLPLTKVASSPTAGQYAVTVATGTYIFATADAPKVVLISYTYTLAGGSKIVLTNQLMGYTPTFQANLYSTFQSLPITVKLPNCVSNKLAFPVKLDDYVYPEFDFSIYADVTGNIGTWSFAEAS